MIVPPARNSISSAIGVQPVTLMSTAALSSSVDRATVTAAGGSEGEGYINGGDGRGGYGAGGGAGGTSEDQHISQPIAPLPGEPPIELSALHRITLSMGTTPSGPVVLQNLTPSMVR